MEPSSSEPNELAQLLVLRDESSRRAPMCTLLTTRRCGQPLKMATRTLCSSFSSTRQCQLQLVDEPADKRTV